MVTAARTGWWRNVQHWLVYWLFHWQTGRVLISPGLSPPQPIVLKNLLSELLHRKYHKICPRALINNQMKKEFFHCILIIYWLSRWPIVNNMNWIVVTQSGHYDTVALGSPNAMGLNGRERVTRPIIVHVKVTTWSFKKEIHFFRPIHECKSCCLFRDWIRRVTSEGSPPLDLIRPFSLSFYKLHHRAKRKPTKGGISEKPLHVLKPSSWLNI